MRFIRAMLTAMLAIILMTFGVATASADHAGEWSANADSEILSPTEVLLGGPNTSVETGNLNLNVDSGDVISFEYELHDGAICGAGAPRVFVSINGNFYNSFDGNPDQCSNPVQFAVGESGLITQTGVVFDQSGGYVAESSVTVRNLTVNGELVHFMNPEVVPEVCQWNEELTAEDEKCEPPAEEETKTATPEPTDEPTSQATTSGTDSTSSQETLPDTGVSLLAVAGAGLLAVLLGIGIFFKGRKVTS